VNKVNSKKKNSKKKNGKMGGGGEKLLSQCVLKIKALVLTWGQIMGYHREGISICSLDIIFYFKF